MFTYPSYRPKSFDVCLKFTSVRDFVSVRRCSSVNMESPFKTPSKPPMSQVLPSSSSSSPFTPKRSLIRKKSEEQLNSVPSVSRKLAFDDSFSQSLFNRKLEFSPLSQQVLFENEIDESEKITPVKTSHIDNFRSSLSIENLSKRFKTTKECSPSQQPLLPCENENFKSEQTTPVKTPLKYCETNSKILLSPSIQNRPKRFNITENQKHISSPSPNKRNGSNNSTPSKRFKSNVMDNSKPITHYFKPTQKRPDSINNKVINDCQLDEHISNEENLKYEYCAQSTSGYVTNSKLKVPNKMLSKNMSLSLKNKKQKSPSKNITENEIPISKNINKIESPKKTSIILSPESKKNISPEKKTPKKEMSQSNVAKQGTPSVNGSSKNNTPMKSPRIIDYLQNKVVISGGDTYSRFIKHIVLKGELIIFGKEEIMSTVDNSSDDELKIYGRLISRKHGWIRYNEPDGLKKYKEKNLCADFDGVLESLASKKLINTGIYGVDIKIFSYFSLIKPYILIFRCNFL